MVIRFGWKKRHQREKKPNYQKCMIFSHEIGLLPVKTARVNNEFLETRSFFNVVNADLKISVLLFMEYLFVVIVRLMFVISIIRVS